MKARKIALLATAAAWAGCGGQGGSSSGSGSGGSPNTAVNNVQPVQVTFGPANDLVNGLFTSVTICVPGTANCQTIDGVQVDTGSDGLRLLSS
jgi:hypothetical protein